MRLLVECTECARQYDVSGRRVGSRFRCRCGLVVEVRQPQGHDARVVRCSGCGAARPDGAGNCAYCESEFTLHERDLNTVCPHCLARVSDRARFCHHCATRLAPQPDDGMGTELSCPACQDDERLVNRKVGTASVAVMECGRCAGFWMWHEAFRQLAEAAQDDARPPGTTPETPRQVAARFGLPADAVARDGGGRGSFYRPCAVCGALMVRRNYGRESGVIVDTCREHGIWFDAEELARILAWLRAGGREPTREEKAPAAEPPEPVFFPMPGPRRDFFAGLIDFLFRPPDRPW